jgi:hypothetical protein
MLKASGEAVNVPRVPLCALPIFVTARCPFRALDAKLTDFASAQKQQETEGSSDAKH